MKTDIHVRSTAKNWLVSVRRTSLSGQVANAPLATIPRRAYAACALAAAVTAAQKMFFADNVIVDTDKDGLHLLGSLNIIEDHVIADAMAKFDAIAIREGV